MPDPALDLDHARWARARDDYRAGLTATEVCARHQIGRSAFFARAQAERWRRADLPSSGAAPPEEDDFDPSRPRGAAAEIAEQAHRRLAHAVEKGRLREALGWSRLARDLRALAEVEENMGWRRQHAAWREAEAQAQTQMQTPAAREAQGPAREPAPAAPHLRSPAPAEPQATDPVQQTAPEPDCPDSFFESADDAACEGDLDAVPPEVLLACRQIMAVEPDAERAWDAILPLLEAARPDIGWRGGDIEDEPFDEAEPQAPP